VPQEHLADGLQDAREQIKIMLNTLNLDELSQVWHTFTQPFRLSVLYEISVVQLDMLPESERTMAPRVRQVGVPDVRAPFQPPVVNHIEPVSGQAGAAITIHGQHLAGWRASVRVTERVIMDGQELTGDVLTVTMPGDLPPGFHAIRVDISHLYRRTFFFEVVA
jgi:hypothetical protein